MMTTRLGWMLVLGCAAGVVHGREEGTMTQCERQVQPGAALEEEIARLPDGGTLCLAPGRYPGGLRIERSLTLRADGEAVLDSGHQGTVIHVTGEGTKVVIRGVTLTGGNAQHGAAVVVTGSETEVVLEGCVLKGHRARTKWLGGVVVIRDDARVTLRRCRVVDWESDNDAGSGQGVVVTSGGRLILADSLLVGRARKGGSLITVRDNASALIERSTLVNEGDGAVLEVRGTTTDTATATVQDSILQGGEAVRSEVNARVVVDRSVVHGETIGTVTLGPDVRRADPGLEKRDPEPFRPGATSPAIGLARGGGALDLAGRPRPDVRATAGAFER